MAERLVRDESPVEYFKELVEAAIAHQGLAAREMTSFYLVKLLAGYAYAENGADQEPLGVRFALALQAAGPLQRDGLRRVGDLSLFISGYFSDSLTRSLVDVDYYIALGERAYGSLARTDDTLSDVPMNSMRTIPFATLLANDLKGPANESAQVLTITSAGSAFARRSPICKR